MKSPSPESLKILEALRLAVNKALDRKKRLGQYAVVWKDGKPVMLGKELESKKPAQTAEN
ncbi:MAG TPA: hypothetical protein ENJ32_03185 [Crenotrichaceae bacterium]|nr:hypothetical protein [Crenotrichaceae bacterium]